MRAQRSLVVLAVAALVQLGVSSANSSNAASGGSCRWHAAAVQDPHAHLFDRFDSVTATASGEAWAVGDYFTGHEGGPNGSFIEKWNGERWQLVGRPIAGANLWSVAVSSPRNAWAVGDHLLEHWNGQRWQRATPAPVQGGSILWATATHGQDAWLVGERWHSGQRNGATLIERWDGTRWAVVPSPNPPATSRPSDAILQAVNFRSASDAWAVGYQIDGRHVARTLVEHWDGSRWRIVPSPSVRASNGVLYDFLWAVTADRADDAWAVGSYESHAGGFGGGGDHALVLHWNGRRWSQEVLPPIRERTFLHGVIARAGTAWAVGDRGHRQTLIEHWTGTQWTVAPSPKGFALAAASAPTHGRAWAVGSAGRSPLAAQLICQHS
jgi:hypothetical protein